VRRAVHPEVRKLLRRLALAALADQPRWRQHRDQANTDFPNWSDETATFAAACSPQVVLDLLETVDELERTATSR
jgi:hypothetical protein